ncbi:hypothetical protein [Luteipulveratus halotolerans]|uniref:Uncharacterized protein n=1 Tax=Luteipulveratus halotolerans TaxID=1631356 RepID=A0A0L6CPJ6_9MICO|nr:hypothetical protein [Luteipulveratus halotolerans]KNX39662.1 hypothetical protein VV01_00015 [Luteipulveratus halotolerans]KNX39705.1 hypothetical protein VV01_00270 [Luteipulveratus halotolerans]
MTTVMTGSGYRTDPIPRRGTFLIEDTRHCLWLIVDQVVFRVGGGEGQRLSGALMDRIGPWRPRQINPL